MRRICILFAALLGAITAQAKCLYGLEFWPVSRTIGQKAIFVVDGHESSQGIITGLGSSYNAYLKAETEHIPLLVQKLLVGQFNVTQAVLKPQTNLTVGKQYELVIEDARYKGQNVARRLKMHSSATLLYTVVPSFDQTAPTWTVLPKEKAKRYIEMGCGPDVAVEFFGAVQDQSDYLIKATVKDLDTGKVASYYVRPRATSGFELGHGMCSGPFLLEKGKNFSVVFALMDAAGNTTNWTGKAIAFTAPVISG